MFKRFLNNKGLRKKRREEYENFPFVRKLQQNENKNRWFDFQI